MFPKKCFCKGNISKIVRPLLAALSVNGLSTAVSGQVYRCEPLTLYGDMTGLIPKGTQNVRIIKHISSRTMI